MATPSNGENPPVGRTLDLKDLLLGAAALVMLFGGSLFTVWSDGFARDIQRLSRELEQERLSNIEQWKLINEYTSTVRHLEKMVGLMEEGSRGQHRMR